MPVFRSNWKISKRSWIVCARRPRPCLIRNPRIRIRIWPPLARPYHPRKRRSQSHGRVVLPAPNDDCAVHRLHLHVKSPLPRKPRVPTLSVKFPSQLETRPSCNISNMLMNISFFLSLVATLYLVQTQARPDMEIIGGAEVPVAQSTFTVGLRTSGSGRNFCGGSLISSTFVLTAAHCAASIKYVSIGSHFRSGS